MKFWFPVFIYSGIIFYVSSLSNVSAPVSFKHLDKLMHIIEFIPFGFLCARAIYRTKQEALNVRLWYVGAVGALIYGLTDEFHQSFVSGRTMSIMDAIADMVGGAIGGYIYQLRIRNRDKSKTQNPK